MKIAILATLASVLISSAALAAGTCPPKSNPHVFVNGSCEGGVTISRSVPTSRSIPTSRSVPTNTVQLAAMQQRRGHQGVNPAAMMAIPMAIMAQAQHQQRHRPHHRHRYVAPRYQQPVQAHSGHRGHGGVMQQRAFGSRHGSGYQRQMYSREQVRMTTKRELRGPPEPVLRRGDMHRVKAAFENF